MTVLITGVSGMIGSELVKRLKKEGYTVIGIDRTEKKNEDCEYYQTDLGDIELIRLIIQRNNVNRIIHLAALAHTEGELDLTWDRYFHINVECARNIFVAAGSIPVLFISTIDVYGFYDGKEKVTINTPVKPVSNYGKSKAMAEEECKKIPHYTIFRFSPVYTNEIKRDIQKRYYLKYPNIAYQIGKGSYYEILNIKHAVDEMVRWCSEDPVNEIRIIKDETPMWTPDFIEAEKKAGRAKIVLKINKWVVVTGYRVIKLIFGENEKTYLLNKALHPLETE